MKRRMAAAGVCYLMGFGLLFYAFAPTAHAGVADRVKSFLELMTV